MALFFDQDWFRTRLSALGKTHDELAKAAGLTLSELTAVWKDQMEVTADMVAAFAAVLEESPQEVASRCGVTTPNPAVRASADLADRSVLIAEIAALKQRLDRVESELAVLKVGQASKDAD